MEENPITVGVAGHVDHGKTALVRCLTGIDTDRMQEEKRRGLSIRSGVAVLRIPGGSDLALMDVPGHTDFMKNTIRGLSAVDAAILVVAADDGVMPQTGTHLRVLDMLGARTGICVLSKSDLVDDDTLELAALEVTELVQGTFLQGAPILPFSAPTGAGREAILDAVARIAGHAPGRDRGGAFRLWVDQVRRFPGIGTVVSGTVVSGSIQKDEPLMVVPAGRRTRVRSLENHGRAVDRIHAGQRAGVSLHRISPGDAPCGSVLVPPDSDKPASMLNVILSICSDAPGLKPREKCKLYLGTALSHAVVIPLSGEGIGPGERALVQLRLSRPAAARVGDRFVLTAMNRPVLLGSGRVLEITGVKIRPAVAPRRIPYLQALESGDVTAVLDAWLCLRPGKPILAESLSAETGIFRRAIEREVERRLSAGALRTIPSHGPVSGAWYEAMGRKIRETVNATLAEDPLKRDMKVSEIADRIGAPIDPQPLRCILHDLCESGAVVLVDGGYRTPDLSHPLPPRQEKLAVSLRRYAARSGIAPFTAHAAWKEGASDWRRTEVDKVLNYLFRRDELVRFNNNRYLSHPNLEEIKARVREAIITSGGMTVTDSKSILGYGRLGAIPVLEYLDEIGFTVRTGDMRQLAPEAAGAAP